LKDTTLHAHLPLCDELCDTVDEQLFDNVRLNASHILSRLLPPDPQRRRTTAPSSCT